MQDYSKYLTGKVKRVSRFRKDRNVWEDRFYHELLDCKGKSVWIRKEGLKHHSTLEYNFFICDYEPYRKERRPMSRFYRIWHGMKGRCQNTKRHEYGRYGGRGIEIDDAWNNFSSFYDDMHESYSDNLEIDRIDNNGNYTKENCRWTTRKQQCNNTKWNKKITINGETLNISQWAERVGKKPNTITTRIVKYGWKPEDAVLNKLKKNQYAFE